jgi:ABC-type transport system involved in multi-copper enzyme maturation permease subunit
MRRSSLIGQTLSDYRRPALWWGLGWFFFGLLIFFISQWLRPAGLPWLLNWLGMLAGASLHDPGGLLAGLGLGLLLPLGLGIYSTWLGSNLLGSERATGTLAMLLASPMPRTRLFDARLAVFLLLTIAPCLGLGLLFELLAVVLGPDLPFGRFLLSMLHILLLIWLPGGISLLASTLGAGQRRAFAWGLFALLVILLHNFIASLFPLPWLVVTSLLQLAARGGILQAQPIGWHSLVLFGLVMLVLLIARGVFSTRDLEI